MIPQDDTCANVRNVFVLKSPSKSNNVSESFWFCVPTGKMSIAAG